MAFARDVYTASASQTDFTISFPYIDSADVLVYEDGTLKTVTTDYTLPDATTVRFNVGLTGGETIVIQRSTSQSARLVTYTAGPLLTDDLNNDSLQAFYMAQEALDGANTALGKDSSELWDAGGTRIINVGTPTDSTDAVTKAYADALAIADGNVVAPTTPGQDNYTLGSDNAGGWDWQSEATMRTRLGLVIGTDVEASVITTRGDIVRGDSSGDAERLALGADGTALVSDGTDIAYEGVVTQGKHSMYVPAGAMYARATNGAAPGSIETSSNNVVVKSWDFDQSADEFIQFVWVPPKKWNAGTVSAIFHWSHTSGGATFGVRFFIQGMSLTNDEALDTAFGTAVGHTADTGGTADDLYITAETSAVTIAGAAKDEQVHFQIYRDISDAGDTLDLDARLHGITLFYTIDAADDA